MSDVDVLRKKSDDLVRKMRADAGLVRVVIDGKVFWVRPARSMFSAMVLSGLPMDRE